MPNTPDNSGDVKILSEPQVSVGSPEPMSGDRPSKGVSLRIELFLLCLMAAFFLVINVAMFAGVRFEDPYAGLALGTIAAEITLCAVLAALAPASVFLRMTIGMFGAIVVCLAVFRMGGPGSDERLEISVAAFLQWIAVQIPLWVFRLRSGWCLQRTSDRGVSFMRQDLQFGIRQLMAWTAVVAVLLSTAKTAIPDDSIRGSRNAALEIVEIVIILVVFNSLAAWPMIWAAFVRTRMLAWCGVAVACSALLCAGEVWAFRVVVGVGVNPMLFVAMHLIQFTAVGGSLLLIRLNGIRLVRAGDSAATMNGTAACPGDGE